MHAQRASELAGHRGLEVLRHIGRRQLQRQRFGGDLHLGVLGGGFAFKRQLAFRSRRCVCLRGHHFGCTRLGFACLPGGGHGGVGCIGIGQHQGTLEGNGLLQRQGQVGEFQAQAACLQGCGGLGGLVSPVHRAISHAGARHAHHPRRGGFDGWLGRLRGGFLRERRGRWAPGQLCQVQASCGVALGVQYGLEQFYLGQVHHLLQRAHIGHVHRQAIKGQQVLAFAVGHLHIAGLHLARELHRQSRCLLKSQLHVHVQRGRLQPDGQAGGQVAQVGRQVQVIPADVGVGVPGLRKRRALGRRVKTAAFQREGQPGLHAHFFLVGQRADERH